MYSSLLHVRRASPCISAEFKQRGGDAKRPGPPRCSSQLHGVPNQSREAVLERVALYTEAVSAPSLAARVFTHDPAKRSPECEEQPWRRTTGNSVDATADTLKNTYDANGGSATLKENT